MKPPSYFNRVSEGLGQIENRNLFITFKSLKIIFKIKIEDKFFA